MSKVLECKIDRWPGTVTIAEPMTLPQVVAYEAAVREAQDVDGKTWAELHTGVIPHMLVCVEEFNLKGLDGITPETFPGTPRKDSTELVNWLMFEILAVYTGEKKVPNE